MAKKKRTSVSGRKRGSKKEPKWLSSFKHGFYTACFVVVIASAALYIYQVASPYVEKWDWGKKESSTSRFEEVLRKQLPAPKEKEQAKKPGKAASKPTQTSPAEFPQNAELPRCLSKVSQQIIQHEGYTVSYNSDYRVANWVAYELTSSEAKSKKNERSNKFVRDPQVKGASAENGDYTRTGYDRGHLAPAGDMKWSAKAMRESFYLSNITPQKPGLNRGVWKDLEEQCRMWATDNGALLIATGPVLTPDLKRLGKNRVAIPKLFYKVICTVQNNRYEAIGFLFENRDYGQISLKDLMIPVDSVEKVTHIDFFPTLPDEVEKRMEASVNKNAWSF